MTDLPTPKHPWFEKFRKSLLYLVIFVVGILTHFFYQQQTITTNSQGVNVEQKIENKVSNESEESSETLAEQDQCISKTFDKDQWNRQRFSQEENGFWCPKESFIDPVMWLQEGFSLEKSSFSVEYEIKKGKIDFGKPPSFILEYALKKDTSKKVSDETTTPIYKLWTPEGEVLQLFRFSKNEDYSSMETDLNKQLTPEEAYTLSSPVKVGKTDKMTIFFTGKNGNELNLNFSYNYTALELNKGLLDTVTKTVKLPVSDVTSTKEIFYYGIGTFKGNCIRPVSYTVCH